MLIRPATAAELPQINRMIFASKAHWGYDAAFMRACRGELTQSAADLARRRLAVAVDAAAGGDILCAVGVEPDDPPDLAALFVAPGAMGRGIGRQLFAHAAAIARAGGAVRMRLDADPHAEAFYRAMGCKVIGRAPSGSIPGRYIPRMEIDLIG